MSDFIKARKAKRYNHSHSNASFAIHDDILYCEPSPVTSLLRLVMPGGTNIDIYTSSSALSHRIAEAVNKLLEEYLPPEPSLAEAIDDDIPF